MLIARKGCHIFASVQVRFYAGTFEIHNWSYVKYVYI